MRLFSAALLTESSDFSSIPTTQQDWKIERPGQPGDDSSIFNDVLRLLQARAEEAGWSMTRSLCATAFPPGGRTVRSVYESMRDEILDDLKSAMPIDGVLLLLHGAALAHGYDDCEGDILERVRNIVGKDTPIGVELDPHCHLTEKMVRNSTAIVTYKTFAHTDIEDRASELFDIIEGSLLGRIQPVMAVFDCRMIDVFDEQFEPMKSFFASVIERETEPDLVSISPIHGFPFADVPDLGSKMLVISNDNAQLALRTAEECGRAFFECRGQMAGGLDTEAVLSQAKTAARSASGPVTIVDFGDFSGCGFATDSTDTLAKMLAMNMTDVVVGVMWDPMAVSICQDCGEGAHLRLRIGGKASCFSGQPLDLEVTVEGLFTDFKTETWLGNIALGDVAVLRSGETQLVLSNKRALGYSEKSLAQLGVKTDEKQFLLMKYTTDIEGSFVVYGPSFDYRNWPAARIARPRYPWDSSPFDVDAPVSGGNPR